MVNWKRFGIDTTGAVAGATAGAALGSTVPVIGTAIGAGIGAVVGGLTGEGGYREFGPALATKYAAWHPKWQKFVKYAKWPTAIGLALTNLFFGYTTVQAAYNDAMNRLNPEKEVHTKIIDSEKQISIEGKNWKNLQDGKFSDHPNDFAVEKNLKGDGYVQVNADGSVDVATWEGAAQKTPVVQHIAPEQRQAFLEDLCNAPVEVVGGEWIFHGANAQTVAAQYMGIPGVDVTQVVVLQDLNKDTGKYIAFAEATKLNGSKERKQLDKDQIMSLNDWFGNMNVDKSFEKALDERVHIGIPNLDSYIQLVNFGKIVGKDNLFGKSLDSVVSEVGAGVAHFDDILKTRTAENKTAGIGFAMNLYAVQVSATTGVPIENLTAALKNISTPDGQAAYLTQQMTKWADKRVAADGSSQDGINQAMAGFRDDIWNTYSNVSGVNYLAKAGINAKADLKVYTSAADLLKLTMQLEGLKATDANRASLVDLVFAQTGDQNYSKADLQTMNNTQLYSLLDTDALADYVHFLTGKETKGLSESQLRAEIGSLLDPANPASVYIQGFKAGEKNVLLQQGNADAVVLGAGSNGATLDSWLDIIGQAGRFDYTWTHSADGTNAYNNFTKEAAKANVTFPTNLTVKYDLNRYTFRITDTVAGGSLMTFYNKDGNLLTTDTKILNKDQTNFAKKWAKDYKVWSGPTEDE